MSPVRNSISSTEYIERITYFRLHFGVDAELLFITHDNKHVKPILLLGASGRLGRSINKMMAKSSLFYHSPSKLELDLSDSYDLNNYLKTHKPSLIIHAASNLTPRNGNEVSKEREAKLTQLIDSNVIQACITYSTELIYISTSLIYGLPKSEKYSESDLGSSKINNTSRAHYIAAKLSASLKIAKLNQIGFPFSSIILPNLLAGPLPNLNRIDHLCENLYQLVKRSVRDNKMTVDFDISSNPRLQMLSSLEVAMWITRNLEAKLPGIVNLTNRDLMRPSELLLGMIQCLELDIKVIQKGIASDAESILLSDTLARTNFSWDAGLSSRYSVECWISELRNDKLL